jgi:hypothetical protein|tara:strand:- start:3602 stop:4447 length:846 start_codon:yes stop_codon:yes gene_type:complete
MIKHNKKRNTLLIYEFLVRSLVESILIDNKAQVSMKLSIIKKYFTKGTELHEEFKLLKSLSALKTDYVQTVDSLFESIKKYSMKLNKKIINKEKTKLINEIHNTVDDKNFYKYSVSDYMKQATVQNLFNEYLVNNEDFESQMKISLFEDRIRKMIIENNDKEEQTSVEDKKIYNNTTTRVIVHKFNKKYKNLNETQKTILKKYTDGDGLAIEDFVKYKNLINNHVQRIKADDDVNDDQVVFDKLVKIEKKLNSLDESSLNESTVLNLVKYAEIMNFNGVRL